jgi:ABC-type multidrug transport system permease subunit
MPSSWFYHNYPKAAARVTKVLMIWLVASIIIGFFIDRLIPNKKAQNQAVQPAQNSPNNESIYQDKSLLITVAIVALVFLVTYFILERTGIISKIGKWYSNTQSAQTTFTERPTSRDFNELGD